MARMTAADGGQQWLSQMQRTRSNCGSRQDETMAANMWEGTAKTDKSCSGSSIREATAKWLWAATNKREVHRGNYFNVGII